MARTKKPVVREQEWFPTNFRQMLDNFWNVDKFFDDDFVKGNFMPAVNVKDNDKEYLVEVAAPGMTKDDFDIRIENGMLCISAERKEEKEEEDDNYTRREFAFRSFQRSFLLPENVNEENIKANYKDGILYLKMQKKTLKEPDVKRIKIG